MSVKEQQDNKILQSISNENIQYFRKLYFFSKNSQFPHFINKTLERIQKKVKRTKVDIKFL